MDPSELASTYPMLYHMAEPESWPGIVAHGLLCTSELLDLYDVKGPRREAIERMRRPDKVRIPGNGLPDAVVRDQKPINDSALSACLTGGMTREQWYLIINGKVFFWPEKVRLKWMMGAPPYVREEHLVITVETSRLLERYGERVTLSGINSGSTRQSASTNQVRRRGPDTFQPLASYPAGWSVAEVAVERRVDDIQNLALRADIMKCPKKDEEPVLVREIWKRP